MNERPSFKLGVDTQTLVKRLLEVNEGESIPYELLSKTIDSDVQSTSRGALESARRIVLRDNQIVFGVIHGIGLKRLTASEVVEQEGGSVSKIRRAANRSLKRLSTADFDGLPPQEQNRHRLVSCTLGAISLCTSTKAQNRLEQRVQSTASKLDTADTLKLFESAAE